MDPVGLSLKSMMVDDNDFGDSPRGLVLAQLDLDMQPLPHFLSCMTEDLDDTQQLLHNSYMVPDSHQHTLQDSHVNVPQQHYYPSKRQAQPSLDQQRGDLASQARAGGRGPTRNVVDDAAASTRTHAQLLEASDTCAQGAMNARLVTSAGSSEGQLPTTGYPGIEAGRDVWPPDATTVMLRNLPNRYTAEELIAEMLAAGFEGAFDFFYLPIDFSTKRNKGYCFINFHSQPVAGCFVQRFHQQRLTRYTTRKILEVSPALTQGLEANVAQYARKDAQRVQNPWFRPMIFTLDSTQNIMDRLFGVQASRSTEQK